MCNNSGGSKIGIILDDKSSFSPRAAITESHLASPHQPDFILELGVNVNQAAFVVSGPVTGSSLFSEWNSSVFSQYENSVYIAPVFLFPSILLFNVEDSLQEDNTPFRFCFHGNILL